MTDMISLEKRLAALEALVEENLLPKSIKKALIKEKKQAKTGHKYKLSARSYTKMEGIHPDLIRIIERAILLTPFDFGITEGIRSAIRQADLVRRGASWVKVSKHQLGLAFDIVIYIDGKVNWDFEKYRLVSKAFKQAAKDLNIEGFVWGGDWEKLRDGPHFQLSGRKPYYQEKLS